jgi:Cupin domain
VTEIRPHVHPGYEFLYVLEGALEIKHGDKTNLVEPGDSVYFDASTPHSYRCAGKESAIALIVTMHQIPVAQPTLNLRPLGAPIGARSSQHPAGSPAASGEKTLGALPTHPHSDLSTLQRS